ncbi:MAG: PKD domain-containing protein, partial [Bacteroidota bacterium]
ASGGSGATPYNWSTGATTAAITVSPATTTTYTVTVTNTAGCTITTSRIVTVNALPTATITPATSTICAGSSATLTASGGSGATPYNWSTGATTAAITVSPATTTTYTVTVTNTAGCTATTSRIVTVNALPTATITPATSTICAGTSATLTASGGSGATPYNWSTGATTAAITVSPATTTTYTVTVTNTAGCTVTTSRIVTVNALPVATITPATSAICVGSSATLTASGGSGATPYNWSTGATTAAITVSPATTTTYTVTVTNTAGCSVTTSRIVTVNALPTATITPATLTICDGASATLTASGGSGATPYNWSTGATTAAITVSPPITTTYTVTVTNTAGCTATISRIVTVNALPVATITPATSTICAGASSTLTASGGSGATPYNWSTGATTAAITVSPATTTTYTVTVTNAAGCTATTSRIVTVNALPTATITPATSTICAGSSATLTASGGGGATPYNWSTGATTAVITVSPATTTTYTVTVMNASGCSATTSSTVTVDAIPTAIITPLTSAICAGGSITLTASGGILYNWSTGASNASITVSPASTTAYTVTVYNVAMCSDTETSTVTVNPLPIANAGTDQTIPNGTSTTLDGSASGGSGTFDYLWSPAGSLIDPAVEDPTTTILSASTTYILTVTDAITGCQNTDNVLINISGGALAVTATASPTSICLGGSSQLDAITGGGSGAYDFVWNSSPAGFSSTTQNPVVNPTVTTTYNVTVFDGFTTATSSVLVTVNPLPAADAGIDQTICSGESVTLTATGGSSYLWSTGVSTPSISVSPAISTTYIVTVSDGTCSATDDVFVSVTALPIADAGADETICSGESVTLTASGGTSYSWSSGDNTESTTVSPILSSNYTVTVSVGSCSSTDDIFVTVNASPIADAGADETICTGEPVTLTASGGSSYSWSSGDNSVSTTVNPIVTTTYTVTVTDNGCSATDDVLVTVNPLPPADAGVDQTICIGESATLTATGGSSYMWSTGGNFASITVTPGISTTYTVTVSDGTCSAIDNVDVNVLSAPVADAGADETICSGESVTLTASGGISYSWSSGDNTESTTVSPILSSNYTVTVSVGSCSSTDDVFVTVNASPIADAGADVEICAGEPVTLTASGGSSYSWSSGDNSVSTTVNPIVTTTYTVTVTDNGCSATDDVLVTVNPLPPADAGVDQTICIGESATLTATGGSSYMWSTGGNFATITVTPGISTTYTVTVSDGTCSAIDNVDVNVLSAPVADAGTDMTICSGESVTLTASGGTSYSWSSGDNTESTTVSPILSTNYTVTVSVGSCSSTDDVFVTVNASPIADAGADVEICAGEPVTLTAGGGAIYEWSSGDNTMSATVNPVVTTIYTVTVTDNGCSSTDDVEVLVNELPQLTTSVTNASCGLTNGTAEVVATGGTGSYTYLWDSNTGDQTTAIAVNLASGTYYVTVDDGICNNSNSAIVGDDLNPVITIFASTNNICEGESIEIIASGADSYLWTPSTGLNTNTNDTVIATPFSTITYVVEGTLGTCSGNDTITITVNPLPVADFSASVNGYYVNFTNLSIDATNYYWAYGDGNLSNLINPAYTYSSLGTYIVMLIASNTCGSDTAYEVIDIVTNISTAENPEDLLNIYPNPNKGYFALEYSSTNNQNFRVDIVNIDGQVVYKKEFVKSNTEFKKIIDISNLAKGSYTLQLTQGENTYNSRFIIVESVPKKPENPIKE